MSEMFVLEESDPTDEKTYPVIDEGTILEAEITKVQKIVKPFKDDDGNPVVRVEFSFKIVDEKYTGKFLWGETPTTFTTHPDCKMRAWVQEILAVNELAKDFKFDTDSIVGSRCRVVVGLREWADKTTGEIKQRNFVSDVIRSREAIANSAFVEPF